MKTDIIAERELVGDSPKKGRFRVVLRIGRPYRSSDVDWACPVSLEGLRFRLADVHGVDSFQALMLALSLMRSLLEGFVEEGGKLSWPENGEQVSVDSLFRSGF